MSEVESVLIRLTRYGDWKLVANGEEIICNEFIQEYNLGKYKPGSVAFLTIKKENNGLIHFKYITDPDGVSLWIWSTILECGIEPSRENTMYEGLEKIIDKLSPKKQPFRADIYLTEIPFSCSGKESMAFINMK
jgi:hypothetical protein